MKDQGYLRKGDIYGDMINVSHILEGVSYRNKTELALCYPRDTVGDTNITQDLGPASPTIKWKEQRLDHLLDVSYLVL